MRVLWSVFYRRLIVGCTVVAALVAGAVVMPAQAEEVTQSDEFSDYSESLSEGAPSEQGVSDFSNVSLPADSGLSMPQKGILPPGKDNSGLAWMSWIGVPVDGEGGNWKPTSKTGGETTADVLGLGYEQRIILEAPGDGKTIIKIAEPASKGSGLLKSFEAKNTQPGYPEAADRYVCPFEGSGCSNIMKARSFPNKIAVAPGHESIYVSDMRITEDGIPEEGVLSTKGYSMISRYSLDGTLLASYKPHQFVDQNLQITPGITSLDAIVYNGKKYVAVGFNKLGVQILDGDTLEPVRSLFTGWDGVGGAGYRDNVSSVKFGVDDSGRLLVAVGRFMYNGYAVNVAAAFDDQDPNHDPNKALWVNTFRPKWDAWVWPSTMTFGRFGPDNDLTLAVGWGSTDAAHNQITFVKVPGKEISDSREIAASETYPSAGVIPSILRFYHTAEGRSVLAVIRQGDREESQDQGILVGTSGAGGLETLIETSPKNLVERVVPGYRAVAVGVSNRSREDVRVQLFSSSNDEKGCWLSGSDKLVGGMPFTGQFTLGANEVSPGFGVAQSLTGKQGVCGSLDGAFFVKVESPDGSNAQVARVVATANKLELRNADQGGDGRFKFELVRTGPAGLLGSWMLTVKDQNKETSPVSAGTIVGKRLTPAPPEGWKDTGGLDDPARPVYRFDVSGISWDVPGASESLVQTKLPAAVAQGSVDGVTWTDLGTMIPNSAPSRTGDRVVLGNGSFYWQTPSKNAPVYSFFRIMNNGVKSEKPVDVNRDTQAPAEITNVAAVKNTEVLSSSLRPNGLDQITARISLTDKNNTVLDPTDPASKELYDRLYFRATDSQSKAHDLLTGLGDPQHPGLLTTVSPEQGMFANDGVLQSMSIIDSMNFYISTTNTSTGRPQASLKTSGNTVDPKYGTLAAPATTQEVPTGGIDNRPLVAASTGVSGFQVSPYRATPTRIQNPTETRPALFAIDEGSFGLQFRTSVIPASASLPLGTQAEPAAVHPLGFGGLRINGPVADLENPNPFWQSGASFSSAVVSHGVRVSANNIIVRTQ